MSVADKMIAYHIARLKDKNPQVRLNAIHELELLEAVAAYEALETLYHTDPDEAVRKAAQRLGLKLYRKMQQERRQGG